MLKVVPSKGAIQSMKSVFLNSVFCAKHGVFMRKKHMLEILQHDRSGLFSP